MSARQTVMENRYGGVMMHILTRWANQQSCRFLMATSVGKFIGALFFAYKIEYLLAIQGGGNNSKLLNPNCLVFL